MKTTFVHKGHNSSLILIMAGWNADSSLFSHINRNGWDLAVTHDFSSLDFDDSFLEEYSTVYLYAWSLGVFIADRYLKSDKITAAFAVNGTPEPINDFYGIPSDIYIGTENNLSLPNLLKFRRRMFDSASELKKWNDYFPEKSDIENLKNQLTNIRETAGNNNNCSFKWNKVYIGNKDRIFPPDNQFASWSRKLHKDNIIFLDSPHFIDFSDIINATIPDYSLIGKHFTRALNTYDSEAIAQKQMADNLFKLLNEEDLKKNPDVLEIGPGTGIFTKKYVDLLKPRRIDFVDVAEIAHFCLIDNERYHKYDAENFIKTTDDKWDVILSSATMQWFVNPHEFLVNVAERLNPGGMFIASSFLPGNLSELDILRPSPIIYPALENLKQWMEENFEDIAIHDEKIKLEFVDFRHLLLHIRLTGVGGTGKIKSEPKMAEKQAIKSLTYRPVYLKGYKKSKKNNSIS